MILMSPCSYIWIAQAWRREESEVDEKGKFFLQFKPQEACAMTSLSGSWKNVGFANVYLQSII